MKAFLEWVDSRGGIFGLLIELGLGLFVCISLARCAFD
jgi:hypothetical protein